MASTVEAQERLAFEAKGIKVAGVADARRGPPTRRFSLHSGRPTTPVPGAWLTGSHSETQSGYATFGESTSFKNCSPSEIWVYADEDPLNTGLIGSSSMPVAAATPEIIQYPSTRHQNAGGFGFCDGHAEMHRWQSTLFVLSSTPGVVTATGAQVQDWFWFAWHATRSSSTGTVA